MTRMTPEQLMAWLDDELEATQRPAEGLRRVARYQRWLIAVVLGQLGLWGGFLGLAVLTDRHIGPQFPLVLTFILGGVGAVYVFLLSWELRGGFAAFVFAAATVVPCLGLLVLTLVNGDASAELKRHGVRVGVFGASDGDIADRPSLYDDEDAGW